MLLIHSIELNKPTNSGLIYTPEVAEEIISQVGDGKCIFFKETGNFRAVPISDVCGTITNAYISSESLVFEINTLPGKEVTKIAEYFMKRREFGDTSEPNLFLTTAMVADYDDETMEISPQGLDFIGIYYFGADA